MNSLQKRLAADGQERFSLKNYATMSIFFAFEAW
jgi:hypothetical protein